MKVVDKSVKITWYKNTTIIRESEDIQIFFDGTVTRLSISKCKVSHSATYKVLAKNEFGEDESSATLTVKEKKEEVEEESEEEEEEEEEEVVEEKKEVSCQWIVAADINNHRKSFRQK